MTIDDPSMEPGDGPVHYQISITGRQAAAFFLGLLVSLGFAFFFGMKTGAAARRGPNALQSLAQVSDLPVPTPAPAEAARPVTAAAATSDPAEAPRPVETGEKRLGFDDAAPAEADAKAEAKSEKGDSKALARPTPKTETKDGAKEVARSDARSDARKAPASQDAPKEVASKAAKDGVKAAPAVGPPATPVPGKAALAAKPAPDAKKAAATWFVQALATKNAQAADDLAKRLRKAGWKADVSLAPNKPGVFRVRVGPYAEKAKAEAAAKKIRDAEKAHKLAPAVVTG